MEYGTLAEKKALSARSSYWTLGAILLAIVPIALSRGPRATAQNPSEALWMTLLVVRLVGVGMWVVACAYYARSKGWSGILGVLGVFTIFGVFILVLFPDKWRKALKAAPAGVGPSGPSELTNYPR